MKKRLTGIGNWGFSWKKFLFLAVLLIVLVWMWETPSGLLGKADAIGYAICHRIEARSFHLGERQLPLCARCMGMYLGAMLGLIYQGSLRHKRSGTAPWRVLVILGFLGAAFAADGLNSYLSLFPGAPTVYTPNNTLRLLTGSGMGIALSVILFPAFNQSVWKDHDPRPAMEGFRPLAGLLAIGLLVDALVLTNNPLVLYPLALISAFGSIILLTIVYTMVWLIVFKAENRYSHFVELAFPLVAGFGIALLQIGALDLVRFLLTHSWEGFYLG
jgi:uncharacterized membrane protein